MAVSSVKKGTNRYFNGVDTVRLIVTVEADTVAQVDSLLGIRQWGGAPHHPCRKNRAEFVRQAIAEKLERDQAKYPSQKGVANGR